MSGYSVAIVGATGLVGSTLISLLEERAFPVNHLFLTASQNSTSKSILFHGKQHHVTDLSSFDFSKTNLAFFCVGSHLVSQYAPIATSLGNIVIDKSNYYRTHEKVPLVIPEVNVHALVGFDEMNIIANPNCNTIPIAVALKPIYDAVGIHRINIATYQSVSGTGKEAVVELTEQTKQILSAEKINPRVYRKQIAFNVLPHCDDFQENGYTLEEMKMVLELRKIFSDDQLAINPTAVRVPVYYGHAAAVHIETKSKIRAAEAIEILNQSPGIKMIAGEYPYSTPAEEVAGNDHVYVGRVREDISHEKGLNLWVVADNLRKGAALNAVQIAEYLHQQKLS